MNFLKNFLILIIITTFSLGCVEKNNVRVAVPENFNLEQNSESAEEVLLTADMKDAIKISLPNSLVKWAWDGDKEKGVNLSDFGTTTWGWEKDLKYAISLREDTKDYYQNKYKKYGEMGKKYYLDDAHYSIIERRFRNYLTKKQAVEVFSKAIKKEGFLMGELPFMSLVSLVKHPGIWRGADRIKTIFFINKKGKWCLLYLTNIDGKNPVDLLKIVDTYSTIDYGDISAVESTGNQG